MTASGKWNERPGSLEIHNSHLITADGAGGSHNVEKPLGQVGDRRQKQTLQIGDRRQIRQLQIGDRRQKRLLQIDGRRYKRPLQIDDRRQKQSHR